MVQLWRLALQKSAGTVILDFAQHALRVINVRTKHMPYHVMRLKMNIKMKRGKRDASSVFVLHASTEQQHSNVIQI